MNTITPSDTFVLRITGLDESFNNSLAICAIKQKNTDINLLPNFENGTLTQSIGIIENSTIEIVLQPHQTAILAKNTVYLLEVQFIKTNGQLISRFFDISTSDNILSLVDAGESAVSNYKYLGQFAEQPLIGNSNEIFYNTTENKFYLYFANAWQDINNLVSPLPNFDPVFLHEFSKEENYTISTGTTVTAVQGIGSTPFEINSTMPVSGQVYNGELLNVAPNVKALRNGILNGVGVVDLSTYQDFTQVILFRFNTAKYARPSFKGIAQFLDSTISAASRITIESGWTTQAGTFFDRNVNTPGDTNARTSIEDNNWHTVVITRNSGIITIYIDGVKAGDTLDGSITEDTAPIQATGISYGAALGGTGAPIDGNNGLDYLEAGFYPRGLNPQEVQTLEELYKLKFKNIYKSNSVLSQDLWLYCGNSIGAGFFYGNSAKTPAILTMKALDETYSKPQTRWHNISKGGITTPQMIDGLNDYYLPFVAQTTGECRVLLHEGTNHIEVGNAASGQEVYDALKEFGNAVKTAGATQVYIGTILPRNTFDAEENTIRNDANALILANAVADGFIPVDFSTNPNLTNASNTTYFSDGTHLQIAGAEQLAITWASVINANI